MDVVCVNDDVKGTEVSGSRPGVRGRQPEVGVGRDTPVCPFRRQNQCQKVPKMSQYTCHVRFQS